MMFSKAFLASLVASSTAFTGPSTVNMRQSAIAMSDMSMETYDDAMKKKLKYVAGGADTEFARRFRHLVGKPVKTVGEAFADFTAELEYSINPLYKNMVTDLVGVTHLIVVNACFTRDAVWSLGILTALDLLLKNYPEPEIAAKIKSSLFVSLGMDQATIEKEAEELKAWASTATKADVEAALDGTGSGPLVAIAKYAKEDEFWFYSRYFGIGLVKVMEQVGVDMEKDAVYPVMEEWMEKKLGKSPLSACSDSDLYFKVREKLDMMETMMKEIEIREKKRMAERLEQKADMALKAAEREEQLQEEIAKEAASNRDRVASS